MTSSTPSTATPTRHAFDRKVEECKPSKADINLLIMDYLVNEGYPIAAKKFAVEANIPPPSTSAETIQERVEIRNAILGGQIQSAIEKINDLNPQLLDKNTSLHFSLLRLQLVELIRHCTTPTPENPHPDISPALEFATTHLAPRAPTSPEFLDDLERTMALLIFPPENLAPPLAELIDPQLRMNVAQNVNQAILQAQGCRREARIRNLVRLRTWAEVKAREAKRDLPADLSLGLIIDKIDASSHGGAGHAQNGSSGNDTVMGLNGAVDAESMVT